MTHVSDEFLSALIDGEPLPSAEAAHVDECEPCQERLEQLRGVVAVVAAPVTIPAAHVREAAVAAAMVETTGVTPSIRRLVTRRERAVQSRPTPRRMSTASAAAALVVALGVGGFVLSQVGRDGGDTGSTTSAALKQDRDQAESATAAADDNSLFSTAPAGGGNQAFGDLAAIEAKYREESAVTGEDIDLAESPCDVPAAHALVWHAYITYNEVASYARVIEATDSTRTLQVLRQTDCELLASQALAPSSPR